jgi:hypothetical protein
MKKPVEPQWADGYTAEEFEQAVYDYENEMREWYSQEERHEA